MLYVGRLTEEKGILGLLDAWQAAAVPGLELLVVGDGPLEGELAAAAVAGVRVTGRLAPSRVRELMLTARALVFPSLMYEGQPMAVSEALAAGLPVVAGSHGGLAATIASLGPGWLVETGERGAWQSGLSRLGDDAAVDAGGQRARTTYEQAFTPERSLAGLEAAYGRASEAAAR